MADVTSHERPTGWNDADNPLTEIQAVGDNRDLLAIKSRILLDPAVRQLRRRDRDVLRMVLFESRAQADVGVELGTDQVEFSLLLRRILDDLRHAADGYAAEHAEA